MYINLSIIILSVIWYKINKWIGFELWKYSNKDNNTFYKNNNNNNKKLYNSKNNNNKYYEIKKLHCTLINNKIIYLLSKINSKNIKFIYPLMKYY